MPGPADSPKDIRDIIVAKIVDQVTLTRDVVEQIEKAAKTIQWIFDARVLAVKTAVTHRSVTVIGTKVNWRTGSYDRVQFFLAHNDQFDDELRRLHTKNAVFSIFYEIEDNDFFTAKVIDIEVW